MHPRTSTGGPLHTIADRRLCQDCTSLFTLGRNPSADRDQTSTFVVNSAVFDLDDPTALREAHGRIRRPPPSGLGRAARADNVPIKSPRRNRNPR
eukprot:4818622-Pyramimonas_sp.AAC.1